MVNQNPKNLEQLLSLHADGMLDDSQQRELLVLLDHNASARDAYIDQMMFHAIMLDKFGGRANFLPFDDKLMESESLPESNVPICDLCDLSPNDIWGIAPVDESLSQPGSDGSLLGFLANCFQSSGPFIAKSMVAILALLPLILLFVVMGTPNIEEAPVEKLLAEKSPAKVEPAENLHTQKLAVVAKILRQTDETKWGNDVIASAGSNILLGQRLRLRNGTVDLQMASGVRVLLTEDTTLLLTGPNSLYLERGKLFAKVVPKAIGFTVQTPNADFVDLGTEFGVNVDSGKTSEAKVFVGEVNVQCELQDGEKVRMQLCENEAARVTSGGKVEAINPNTLSFTTVYPDDRACLFDLICHANPDFPAGFWVDPRTGKAISSLKTTRGTIAYHPNERSKQEYYAMPSLSVVDGVFTPRPNTEALVNSAGGRYGGIGNETDYISGYLFFGKLRTIGTSNLHGYYLNLLSDALRDEKNVPNQDAVFMEMQANLGITFDLDEASQHTNRKIAEFRCTARRIAESDKKSVPACLDVIVLADEKPIFEKRGVTFQDGMFPICVDIPEGTRFLSIVAADGRDSELKIAANSGDHVMFYSPAFILESNEDHIQE